MAINSSRASALADYVTLDDSEDSLDQPEVEETEDKPEPQEKKSAKAIKANLLDWIDNTNIARDIDDETLQALGILVCREYEIDEASRSEWKDEAQHALDFATQKAKPKQYPWADASNVIFPLITSASMRFGAIAYPAIVPNKSIVKGTVWGDDKGTAATVDGKPDGAPLLNGDGGPIWRVPPGAKAIRAEKVGEHMSWQLLEQMGYWEEQTDTLLHQIPIVGGAVRKTYRNMRENCNDSELVPLMNLVWNMGAKSFETAPRHTEIQEFYPHEIEEMEREDEMFLTKIYGPGDQAPLPNPDPDKPAPSTEDSEAPQVFIEQHRRYDLDKDGYAEPLLVTVHLRSQEVVRIVARYEEDGLEFDKAGGLKRIVPLESYTLYRFLPNPKGGSYPCGFGHYLKPLNEAINTTLNQMFDAGHLQIAGGGFIATGLSLHGGTNTFSIGEYKPVNTKGANIRDSVFPIPFPGPNQVLFELLGLLIGAGKEVASIQDALTGDSAMANTPPTTMLALVEQGMKVYTAIYKRIYRALKSELKKLYRLNRIYITDDQNYQIGDTWRSIGTEDYKQGGGVEPMADPTMVTDMQRLSRAALIVDRAAKNPMVNSLAAERYLFDAAQIPRVNDFLPEKAPPPQKSPEQIAAESMILKAQTDAKRAEFEVAEAQSKLGLTRAQELKAYTEAMVNFEKVKGGMNDKQIQWMELQLTQMRLHIEALNTTVKAAAIDAKGRADDLHHRGTMAGHAVTHHANLTDAAMRARELAHERATGSPDTGGGGGDAARLPQPLPGGNDGPGLSGLAPPSGDAGGPALPGAQGPSAPP